VQGATYDRLVLCISKHIFNPAMAYVAFSRLTSLKGLYLLDNFDPAKIYADGKSLFELDRLRSVSGLPEKKIPGTVYPSSSSLPAAAPSSSPPVKATKKVKEKKNSPAPSAVPIPTAPIVATPRLAKPRAVRDKAPASPSTPLITKLRRLPDLLSPSAVVAGIAGLWGLGGGGAVTPAEARGRKHDAAAAGLAGPEAKRAPSRRHRHDEASAAHRWLLGRPYLTLHFTSNTNVSERFFERIHLPRLIAQVGTERAVTEAAEAVRRLRALPLYFQPNLPVSGVQPSLFPQLAEAVTAVETSSDGDCLYHSISLSLFGTEEQSGLLRALTVFVLLSNSAFFMKLLEFSSRFDVAGGPRAETLFAELVRDAYVKGKWGNDLSALALSILLGRDVWMLPSAKFLCVFAQATDIDHQPISGLMKDNQVNPELVACELGTEEEFLQSHPPEWKWVRGLDRQAAAVESLSLAQLRDAYARDEEGSGLPSLLCIPGTTLLPRFASLPRRDPLIIHFHQLHYTALLASVACPQDVLPQPLVSPWGRLDAIVNGSACDAYVSCFKSSVFYRGLRRTPSCGSGHLASSVMHNGFCLLVSRIFSCVCFVTFRS
jgi:hypothetical protein